MERALVFDLDGTLLNSDKEISKGTVEVITKLYEIGFKIIIATARPPRYTDFVKDYFSFPLHITYYNGGYYQNGDITFSSTIPKEINQKIINYVLENEKLANLSVEREDKWYANDTFDYETYFNIPKGPEVISTDEIKEISPTKILLLNPKDSKRFKNEFEDICNISITDNGELIQVNEINTSKATGIKDVAESMGLTMNDVTCFGDDHNDIEMFKSCGTSVAMGNAVNELKEIATYITDTNDNEGIKNYLSKILEEITVNIG